MAEGTRPMALKTAARGKLISIRRVVLCNTCSPLTPPEYVVTISALSYVGSFNALSFVRSTLADYFAAFGYELCLRASSGRLHLQTAR
jgi:hypothetical protein